VLQRNCGWILLSIALAATAEGQSATPLASGESFTGVIADAAGASFEISAEKGNYLRAVVIEQGRDLVATVVSPDRKELLKVDRFDASHGREVIALVAPLSGTYVVTVKPAVADAAQGSYEFRLEAVRHPVGDDCLRLDLEEALLEGDRQVKRGTAESLREAVRRYVSAVELAERVGDSTARGEALNVLGAAHAALGELGLAVDPFSEAIAIARATNDRPLEALALYRLGSANGALGHNRQAFENLYAALQLYRDLEDSRSQAATINALAVRFKEIGEIDKALDHYVDALSLSREPGTLNNLGNLYYDQGNWQEALSHFQQALKLWREIGSRRGEAATIYNIGLVYYEQGEIDRALPYIRQALAMARETANRAGEAMCLYRLGLASEDLGELDQALQHLSDALALYHSIGDRRREAIALVCLGRIHARRSEFDQAFDHYQRALPLAQATTHPWGEAFTHKHLGDAWAACGAPLLALEQYRAALVLYHSLGQHVWRARTLVAMAETLDAVGRLPEARDTIDEALSVIEQLQANVTSRELKAAYLSSVRRGYEISIDLLMREGEAEAALHVSERARARSFLDLLAESSANIASDLLQRQRELRRSLTAKIERQIRRREANQKGEADLDVTALTEELEQIERKIRASNPHYARSTDRLLQANEIQKLLDPETILLEYALGERRSFLWVVSSTSISSHVLPPRGAIEPVARRLIELLQGRATALGNEDSLRETSRTLAEMLLGPAARSLNAKRLVIASDGILHYVPFAMLIDRFELVSVPSASSLAALREQLAARPRPPKTLAVFADPVFRREDSRIAVAQARVRETDAKPASLARLPYTRREARAILSFVPPSARKEALDFEASRAAALNPELAQYRVVHFATHGFFNTARPELSGIVLSLVDAKGKEQQGFLLTSDVFGMNLAADLVVLSGCRTALGREVHGEGITGLSRAFLFAGAARVLASLWKVDDAATAALMTHFYRGLFVQKLPPAAALKAAQVTLRKGERWASPYYWAGFVLQGDWK